MTLVQNSTLACWLVLHILFKINVKLQQFTTPSKDDIHKLADLKQQMSQNMILIL